MRPSLPYFCSTYIESYNIVASLVYDSMNLFSTITIKPMSWFVWSPSNYTISCHIFNHLSNTGYRVQYWRSSLAWLISVCYTNLVGSTDVTIIFQLQLSHLFNFIAQSHRTQFSSNFLLLGVDQCIQGPWP